MNPDRHYLIWTNGRPNAPLKPHQTYLRLVYGGYENVVDRPDKALLVACDATGRMLPNGRLVGFRSDGLIKLHAGISTATNLPLSNAGRLVFDTPFTQTTTETPTTTQ